MSEQEFKAMLKEIGYSDYSIEILWANRPLDYETIPRETLREDAEMQFSQYWAKLTDPNKDYFKMPELIYPMLQIGLS